MSDVSLWPDLTKNNVDTGDYLPVTGRKRFQLLSLFPSVASAGVGGESIYTAISNKNQLNFKNLISIHAALDISTVANNVQFNVVEGQIDLSACDNSSSNFLTTAALASDVTGILAFANGGLGLNSIAKGQLLYADAANSLAATSAMSTDGQLLIGNSFTGVPSLAALIAGTNVSIANGPGTITISATLAALTATLDTGAFGINLNYAAGASWISGDGTSEGITVDSVGRVFIGDTTPTVPALTAQLTLGGNSATALRLGNANNYKNTYSIVNAAPTTGVAGATLLLEAGVGGTGNQAGGHMWLRAGAGTGTGQSGDVYVDAGTGLLSTIAGAVRLRTYKGGAAVDALVADNEHNVSIPNGYFAESEAAQSLVGAGAVDVVSAKTHFTDTGANALTLADGVEGQHKYIMQIGTSGGSGTLTPTNLAGGTTITFNAIGDTVHLMFTNSSWYIIGSNGVVVA